MSANTLANSSIVAKEALAILVNMLGFSKNVNRDFEVEFKSNMSRGYAPGSTIYIERPPRYTYRAGRVAQPQPTIASTIPLTVSQGGADFYLTMAERTLAITSERAQRRLTAAMATIVNEIDLQGLLMAKNAVGNQVGTPGTPPASSAAALQLVTDAAAKLDLLGAPRDGERTIVMGPLLNGQMVASLAGLFNNQQKIGSQYNRGVMVDSLGFNVLMDQNVQGHLNGTQPATGGTVNGAGQSGATINVNGGTITGTILRGSVITFANVFAVNPQSRQTTTQLAQFVVTADVAASATSISISPALVPSGQFQNVTNSPANAAGITVAGAASTAYGTGLAYHRDAFALAMVPMATPPENAGARVSQETMDGMTLKYTEWYDGKSDELLSRFDVMFGWCSPYPELAVRIAT